MLICNNTTLLRILLNINSYPKTKEATEGIECTMICTQHAGAHIKRSVRM